MVCSLLGFTLITRLLIGLCHYIFGEKCGICDSYNGVFIWINTWKKKYFIISIHLLFLSMYLPLLPQVVVSLEVDFHHFSKSQITKDILMKYTGFRQWQAKAD